MHQSYTEVKYHPLVQPSMISESQFWPFLFNAAITLTTPNRNRIIQLCNCTIALFTYQFPANACVENVSMICDKNLYTVGMPHTRTEPFENNDMLSEICCVT